MSKMVIGIQERPKAGKWVLLSFQHVFAMFGATVLVPALTGLPISVALVASGIGTLVYILCTKARVPVYLGSSFAYIGAIAYAFKVYGSFDQAFLGLITVGLIYVIVSVVIKYFGIKWLQKLLPPIVVGPMIMIIGLSLATTAISSAGLNVENTDWRNSVVAIFTFLVTIVVALKAKGFLKVIPFLIGILSGYILAILLQLIFPSNSVLINYELFKNASFFELPKFQFIWQNKWDFSACITFAPIAFVTICEHIGDHTILSEITEEKFLENPGLNRTLLGDGLATIASAVLGGPANTTYGENTGVIALTKVASVWVIGLAAIFAILLGFLGYIQAFISSIPNSVMGGISIVLFGFIAANGLKVLMDSKVNLNNTRNVIIIASMLVIGIGGASIKITQILTLEKMALAVIVGVILNLVLKEKKCEN